EAARLVGGPRGVADQVEAHHLADPDAVRDVRRVGALGAHLARLVAVHAAGAEEAELVLAEAVEVLAVEVVEFEAEALEARQVPALGGAHVPTLEVLGRRVEGAREPPGLPLGALAEAAAGRDAVAGARV